MKRRVTAAKLHDLNVVIPGVGAMNVTNLPPQNKSYNSFHMYYTEHGLELEINGVESIIPLANVQIAILAPEETKKSK